MYVIRCETKSRLCPFLHSLVEIGYFLRLRSLNARNSGWTRMGFLGWSLCFIWCLWVGRLLPSVVVGLTLYTGHRLRPLAEMEWNESSGRVRLEPRM